MSGAGPQGGSAWSGLRPPLPVVAIGLGIATCGLLGAVDAVAVEIRAFDLQGELKNVGFNVPVLFTATLLFWAGAISVRLATAGDGAPSLTWLGIAPIFAFVAVDDLTGLHERFERALEVEWLLLYTPLIAVGALLWYRILTRELGGSVQAGLWIAGAGAWALSQALELIGHGRGLLDLEGTTLGGVTDALEEILEMTGTGLFVWALLLLLEARRTPATRPDGASGGATDRAMV